MVELDMTIVYARLTIPSTDNLSASPNNRIETNLVPPNAEGLKIIASGVSLVIFTALWTCMRFWSLRQSGRIFVAEDSLNLGAVVLFYCLIATDFAMVFTGGMGYHVDMIAHWHLVWLLKAIFARQFLYVATLGLVKLSVILMFMRIFFVRQFKLAAMAVMAFTISWIFLTILVELLICQPIEANWSPLPPVGICGDRRAAFASVGIFDIVNQLAILMLPLPMITKLGMETRYKIVTACVLSVGVLTLIFGIIRLYTVLQIDITDVSYTAVQPTIYGTSEVGIAIIVSSCPLLRPVFDRLLPTSPISRNSVWREKGNEIMSVSRKRKSTKSSGFTQMRSESQENLDLELGNMGAHRAKRNTVVTVGKRSLSTDEDDDSSVHRIVVTSETIVSRDKGEL